MTHIEAIDLAGRRILLTSGAVLDIGQMVDADLIETTDITEAAAFSVIGGDVNMFIAAVVMPWPTVH